MESHCMLAAFLKHTGKTISDAYVKFRRSHANYMFPAKWSESCVCAMHLASVLGSTSRERKCRLWNVRSYCCGHKVCSCAHPHDSCEFLINTEAQPIPSQTHPDSPQGWAARLTHPLITPDVTLCDRLSSSLVSTHAIARRNVAESDVRSIKTFFVHTTEDLWILLILFFFLNMV